MIGAVSEVSLALGPKIQYLHALLLSFTSASISSPSLLKSSVGPPTSSFHVLGRGGAAIFNRWNKTPEQIAGRVGNLVAEKYQLIRPSQSQKRVECSKGYAHDARLMSSILVFLLDPHFGGDGLVMVIRHRDPDKTWTIRHPSSWRPNWRRRQGLAVDGPTVRRRTAHGLESEWRER